MSIFYLVSLCAGIMILAGVGFNLSYRPELPHRAANGVYFWKTTFNPDAAEIDFLKEHDVRRIYLRMFDVVANDGAMPPEDPVVPNATVTFPFVSSEYDWESRPILNEIQYVPTVFITVDALRAMGDDVALWAGKIVERLCNMVSYNFIPNVAEFQLDCDWTESTEQIFFDLCEAVKQVLDDRDSSYRLSSTIRLHQLSQRIPPVDFGVLMVYNTGNFADPDARNSIIDLADVEPYLKNLSGYRLPLDVAYPIYTWQLLFRDRRFAGLLRDVDVDNTDDFEQTGENLHRALRDVVSGRTIIRKGDIVRTEVSDYKSISDVKKIIDRRIPSPNYSNTLYHLDSNSFSTFTPNEIDSIYICRR